MLLMYEKYRPIRQFMPPLGGIFVLKQGEGSESLYNHPAQGFQVSAPYVNLDVSMGKVAND